MTGRLAGQLLDGGDPVADEPVFVVDTGPADETTWSIVATDRSAADGSWSVTVPSADVERYHAVAQFEESGTFKNALSKPFLTSQPFAQPGLVTVGFDVLSPAVGVGSAIPDSVVDNFELESNGGFWEDAEELSDYYNGDLSSSNGFSFTDNTSTTSSNRAVECYHSNDTNRAVTIDESHPMPLIKRGEEYEWNMAANGVSYINLHIGHDYSDTDYNSIGENCISFEGEFWASNIRLNERINSDSNIIDEGSADIDRSGNWYKFRFKWENDDIFKFAVWDISDDPESDSPDVSLSGQAQESYDSPAVWSITSIPSSSGLPHWSRIDEFIRVENQVL